MTQQLEKRDENGRFVNSPGPGRPRKGNAIRDLVRKMPIKDKREVLEIALQEIRENHDVAWATWLLKAEGMSPDREGNLTVNIDNRRLVVRQNGAPE